MEYHKNRFDDYSLLVFNDKKVVAVLPANRVGDTVYSHQGLSYGALVINEDVRIKEYITIFKELMIFLKENNVQTFELKLLPKLYNTTIADEIDYLSFLMQANCFRTDVYLAIDRNQEYHPNRNRKRALKIASELNIEIKQDQNYEGFWSEILSPNLKERFQVAPVHTLDEIKKLADFFPNEIQLFNAYQEGNIKAGVVMFLTDTVAHFQYSSGGNDRDETAALDVLFDFIIQKFSDKRYVSFGSSSENNGLQLNEGLAYWKESFGAKTSVQSFLRFTTSNYTKLESI
ncbi:GNAT family N-acetyltransferase [Flavobacterium sp.]|uniref:GNAT family N-acetyltransferase n=1 Tax=Flavobacterium sp. TaxID=239 RepID=UPI002B4B3370|nr:GNAT family N-acetyltransferase [Flavobacterium sp.]HLP63169.1 hypothetical protein [Flavobacterium sp.]